MNRESYYYVWYRELYRLSQSAIICNFGSYLVYLCVFVLQKMYCLTNAEYTCNINFKPYEIAAVCLGKETWNKYYIILNTLPDNINHMWYVLTTVWSIDIVENVLCMILTQLSNEFFICMYIYICICVCVYVYVFV